MLKEPREEEPQVDEGGIFPWAPMLLLKLIDEIQQERENGKEESKRPTQEPDEGSHL